MTPAGKTCRCFYAGEGRTDFGAGEGLAGLWGALLFRMAIRRGAGGRAESHPASMTRDSFAARNSHWRSLTRRLRREVGLAVPRGAHTFLSVAKEKCAKESQRHGDSGKKPFNAHFAGGARNVARAIVGELSHTFVRAPVLTFFRRQSGRAFFPPLPIAALLTRSWLWADSNGVAWDASMRQCNFAAQKADGVSQSCWSVYANK